MLRSALFERRKDQARLTKDLAEQTRRDAKGKHELVVSLAENNAKLTAQLAKLVTDESRALTQTREAARRSSELEVDLKRFEQRLSIAGLNRVLGQLFVERRRSLNEPNWRDQISEQTLEQEIVASGLGTIAIGRR